MKTAIVNTFGEPIQFQEVDIPDLKKDEVLVHVEVCGCCHTDIHASKGDWSVKPKLPLVPGHEGVGIVERIGSDVQGIKEGDRVGIPFLHSTCGKCEYCTSGCENYCPCQLNTGYTVKGCYSQYATIPASFAVRIPDNLSSEEVAPLLCAGVTVYKGLREAAIRAGQYVCIVGAGGGLGHLGIQYAKAMGYRVIAVDFGEEKRRYCESLGAELSIDASKSNPHDIIKEHTNGGPHAVLVIASHPSAFQMAVDYVRRKGIIIALSMPGGPVELDMTSIVLRGVTIRGSSVGTRQDMEEALDFAARGMVKPHVTVDKIENVNEIMNQIAANAVVGRVVLKL